MSVVGIVLAAGASRRMGFPKALARVGGRSFIEATLAALSSADARVIVVGPPHASAIRSALAGSALLWAENLEPERGMLSSLQAGLSVAPRAARAALVSLIDHPRVSPATVSALIGAWRSGSGMVVRPRFRGGGGHPVLIDGALFGPLLAAPPEAHLGEVLARLAPRCELDVDDPGVLDDFDTPVALAHAG